MSTEERQLFSQVAAAKYLGVSVRWFRANVSVEPIPVGPIVAGRKPLLRYCRDELDALIAAWRSRVSA